MCLARATTSVVMRYVNTTAQLSGLLRSRCTLGLIIGWVPIRTILVDRVLNSTDPTGRGAICAFVTKLHHAWRATRVDTPGRDISTDATPLEAAP